MRPERWLVLAGLLLYGLSLLLPAVEGSGFPAQSGLDILRAGAGAWRDGVVGWYANPAVWLALALIWLGRYRAGLGAAAVGLVLALSSFSAASMAERAGRSVPAFSFAIGFYVWLAVFVAAVVAATVGIYKVSSAPPPGRPP
jgi:hypothetical protein